ncbi:hypothetical protein, variant [Aphanomyces invadans]|uniref:Myosin motor domain-containing protein n=1 Tax=Aphanomyces invadans TaxID=157072 RepID=A0A024UMH3_9STRA|nr:hypothetical protein, variant [Aphanomyces invadans]ETW07484.1 hypothetical protein, variant [Aphanomyces invadans]|eukprot:XP_008863577.1 hypothetical protein, variant [Aphanomyces invadans]
MAAMYFVHEGESGREGPFTLPQLQAAFASGRLDDTTLLSTAEDPVEVALEGRVSLRAKMPMHGKAKWATQVGHVRTSPCKTIPRPPPPLSQRREALESPEKHDVGTRSRDGFSIIDEGGPAVQPPNQTCWNQDDASNQAHADVPLAWWANPKDAFKLVRIMGRQPPNLLVRAADDPMALIVVAETDVITVESPLPPPLHVDNLVNLNSPGEPGVLHCLKQRFLHHQIYTNVGKLLVSMNPFQKLVPACALSTYSQVGQAGQPPHVHQVAATTIESALRLATPQSIVISGESGSGKSEVTKLCMQFFSSVTTGQIMDLEGMLLACSPILDAFGNATTIHNANSSRFGKLLKLQVNASGKIDGCTVTAYLLEKSRLTRVDDRERNFHIFYQLCANMDAPCREFAFLGDCSPTQDDRNAWAITMAALDALRFSTAEKDGIVAICHGILHLGNVQFEGGPLVDQPALMEAAAALQCTAQVLAMRLTVRRLRVRGESVSMPLVGPNAMSNRDSLAKALYTRLFDWLLRRINNTMMTSTTAAPRSHILLVDIFGFESFDRNGFDQLCINFANEKLQQMFHVVVFDDALERYRQEGLAVPGTGASLTRPEVLDVMDGKPKGIFWLLDDEVALPKASESSLLAKLVSAHAKATVFKATKSALTFTLVHYAHPVTYDCADFLAKNKDHVADDIAEFCHDECMPLLQEMSLHAASTPARGDATVSAKFRRQLRELLAVLDETSMHFIRCIKPNHHQTPGVVDGPYVVHQLRQMGIFKALALHHGGLHPFRDSYDRFYNQYRRIAGNQIDKLDQDEHIRKSMAEKCADLVQLFPTPAAFSIGKTCVFTSLEMHDWLQRKRLEVEAASVTLIQRVWRRTAWRRACQQLGQCCLTLQHVAATDDAILKAHVEHAKILLIRYPSWHLSRRLRVRCLEGEAHLDRHRRQNALLARIQQPRHDLDAMEADLALCEKWRLQSNPHVMAFTAEYSRLQAERQGVIQAAMMLRSKVIHVATVDGALRSRLMTAAIADRARAVLQEIASEPPAVDALAAAITDSSVDAATLQTKFAAWTHSIVDDAVDALEKRHKWSTSLHATLQLCHSLCKLRTTLRAMTQETVMNGLAALKNCLASSVPDEADSRLITSWHTERQLACRVVDDFDRMHKLLAKAWLCKVPQEVVFLDLCDQLAVVALRYGIPFDRTLVSEAHSMLAAIRQEKLFLVEVESLIAVGPDYAAKSHIHIDRLHHLGTVFSVPSVYDKTEIASNVCLYLRDLRRAAKELFECTTLDRVEDAWTAVQAILWVGHRQFDLLASDKWFRAMAHALEMEQQAAMDLVVFKRASVRVAEALHVAMASNSYDALHGALDQVDRHHLHRDYTLRDLVLRAKDAVQTFKNIRHELRHAIQVKSLAALESAVDKAARLQVHSRLVHRATRLCKSLKQLQVEFSLCQFDTNTDRLAAFVRHCDHLRLPSPARSRVETLLTLSQNKFLQEQLKWAVEHHAPSHDVLKITLALKQAFFQHSGRLFDMQHFPRLRPTTVLQPMATPYAPSHPPVLSTSLTDLDAGETKLAVKISKSIHAYLGNHALYLLRVAHFLVCTGLSSRRLADEIYVQLVQQLLAIHGIDLGRATQAWTLVQICVLTFAPSDGCWNYLESFLRRHNKLALVDHLHAPKPPALVQPDMAALYRIAAPSPPRLRTDGWVKFTLPRQPRRRRKWYERTWRYINFVRFTPSS